MTADADAPRYLDDMPLVGESGGLYICDYPGHHGGPVPRTALRFVHLSGHGICQACWRGDQGALPPGIWRSLEQDTLDPDRPGAAPGPPALPNPPAAPGTGEAAASAADAAAPQPEDAPDGPVRVRWWCRTCQQQYVLPFSRFRPVCPACFAGLVLWARLPHDPDSPASQTR